MNEACGRTGMCVFETTLSTYGTCVDILSQSEDSLVLPMYKRDMADADSGIFVYQNDFEKTCRSGFLNQTTGRCAFGLKSKNKVSSQSVLFIQYRVRSAHRIWTVQLRIPQSSQDANADIMKRVLSTAI